MDIATLTTLVLAAAVPIAAVIGFAVQLRTVKKTRLENTKLQLEIAALKSESAKAEQRIVQPTTAEVERYNDLDRMRRMRYHQVPGDISVMRKASRSDVAKEAIVNGLLILAGILFVAYLVYDLYRLTVWLLSQF